MLKYITTIVALIMIMVLYGLSIDFINYLKTIENIQLCQLTVNHLSLISFYLIFTISSFIGFCLLCNLNDRLWREQ